MAVSFTYSRPNWWFPRSYITRLNCLGNLDVLVVSSSGITMHRAFLDVAFFLPWKYDFFPWSSNVFNMGTLFDAATATCTVFGVPASGGVLVSIISGLNERQWGFKIQAYVENTPNNYVPLPPAPLGYWMPE